jgi:hypothetical protein
VRFPCVHAAATTPVQQMGVLLAQTCPSVSAFPDSTIGSACTSTFSRFARRLLALRPAHSRSHQIRDRYPRASDISSPPCLPRLLPAGANRRVGLAPTGKAPPCHGARGFRSFADTRANGKVAPTAAILRVANNEGHGIIRRTWSRECAISSRAPGLRFQGSMRRAVCPNSSIHVRSPSRQ